MSKQIPSEITSVLYSDEFTVKSTFLGSKTTA